MTATLKDRLAAGEDVDAIVVRTPSYQVIEVLAARGTSCVMIDTEHAAVGPDALDAMLAVAAGVGVAALVRVPAGDRGAIQQALDCGAAGVVVPHVSDPAAAAAAVAASHYGDGGRGYSGSTRSGGWGTRPMADVLAAAAARTVVVAQVEDPAALDHLDAIAATAGVDALFVGVADLAVALGAPGVADPAVTAAAGRIIAAARAAGRSVAAFAGGPADTASWRAAGANLVFHGTDQSRLVP